MVRTIGFLVVLSMSVSASAQSHHVTVREEQILFDGTPTKLIGLRCSNALASDKSTTQLIESLDLYRSYGLNTISVYLMGSRFGDVKGYLPDGSLNPAIRDRMEKILVATDQRAMIVIVGCLYWSVSRAKEDLSDWKQEDAQRAIANTAQWLSEKGFRHVILDPDNEGMAVRSQQWRIESLIAAAKRVNPDLIVANNTKQDPSNEDLNIHFGKCEEGKPWLDSEATPQGGYWGGYSKESHQKDESYYNYSRIGRYTLEMKQDHLRRTRAEVGRFSGYMLASTWLQCGADEGVGGPFADPGGFSKLGSEEDENAAWNTQIDVLHPDAGIRWWLEYVRDEFGSAERSSQ